MTAVTDVGKARVSRNDGHSNESGRQVCIADLEKELASFCLQLKANTTNWFIQSMAEPSLIRAYIVEASLFLAPYPRSLW